jgi:hypothetical protein
MLGWVVNHFMPLVIQNGWESYICSLTAFGARREGLDPPTAKSVGWCSASTPCARVPLMLLRSDAESSQTATVLAGNGWWTDTQTDTPVGGELSEDQEAELYHYYRAPYSRAESPSGLPSDSRRLPLNRRPLMALSHH